VSGARAAKEPARCLVLGYDGSDSSRLAVSWAANELGPGGRLVLVRSGRALHAPASPLSSAQERARVGQAMFDELLLDGDAALLDLELTSEISENDPVSALVESATRNEADAIVIGCESHGPLHRAVGVLTNELLAHSPVPVIAIPAAAKVRRRGAPAGEPAQAAKARAPRRAARRS